MIVAAARRWWLIVALAGVGLVLGGVLSAVTPRSYSASTVLFLGSPVSTDSAGAYAGDLFSQQRAATYAQLFTSDDLAVKVIDDLSLSMTPAALAAEVQAKQIPKTVLLQVTVSDALPGRAADIANAYATNFAAYVTRLETPAASAQSNSSVTVVQKATAGAVTVSPSIPTYLAGGLVGGALVGLAVLWTRRRLDHSLSTAGELAAAANADVLAELPGHRGGVLDEHDQATPYAESLRSLRTNLNSVVRTPAVVLITGPGGNDGTTATAGDLAVIVGELGRKAIVVDANLRSPGVAGHFGLRSGAGLSTVLNGEAHAAHVATDIDGGATTVLQAGPVSADPTTLLASWSMGKLLGTLRAEYNLVILDCPAALEFTDAALLAPQVDGVLLVARAGRTTPADVTKAAAAVRRVGGRLMGTVLTNAR